MMFEHHIRRLPHVVAVIGETWLRRNRGWGESFIDPRLPWYEQLETDLVVLGTHVSLQELIACYRDPLRDQPHIQKTIFEAHGAALLAGVATRARLHVPRDEGSRKNFDVSVDILGHGINAESKTRKDEFPFNLAPESDALDGITWHAGARATIDPHDMANLGMEGDRSIPDPHEITTPESTVIRQILLEGLEQLPDAGCNFVLFGDIEGSRRNLEDALYGAEVVQFRRNFETRKVTPVWVRTPGAFGAGPEGEPFRRLSAILWVRLWRQHDQLGRGYWLYLNPNAHHPVANDAVSAIVGAMQTWSSRTGD
jgi:hypothetical protein